MQRDAMELPEAAIRSHYPQALALLQGFDHAPRIGSAAPAPVAERSPGVPGAARFRSTVPGLAGRAPAGRGDACSTRSPDPLPPGGLSR